MRRGIAAFLVSVFFLASGAVIAAPASPYLELTDPSYRYISKLVAFGVIPPTIVDQRPWTRSEFARLTAEALKVWNLNEVQPPDGSDYKKYSRAIAKRRYIDSVIRKLTGEFHDELVQIGAVEGEKTTVIGHPLEWLRFDGTYLNSAPLTILPSNGVGFVNAKVNPLMDYNEGRHAVDGFQAAVESLSWFDLTKYFAALAHFRIEANSYVSGGQDDVGVYLQEGYGLAQFGDFAITAGRSSIVWGPGDYGALLLTQNPRPLDLIQISTPSPFRLPWVFRHLGQWRISLFGANLGPEMVHKYAWLTGYRLSYLPVRYIELAFGNTTMMGGEGMPSLSALDIFGEFWGFRPAGTSPGAPNKSNHIMEASMLVRIPPLYGLELYGVLANEDKRDTLVRFFRDGSSYLAGFYLPRLNPQGTADLRFEFARMCSIMYRHGLYSDGYTLDQLFIGDDLGSDALGTHVRYNQDVRDNLRISAIFDWDDRSSNMHAMEIEPDGTLGDIYVSQRGPSEQRFRFVLEPQVTFKKLLRLTTLFGYERVLNAGYVNGISKNNWLVAASLRVELDKYFKFTVK